MNRSILLAGSVLFAAALMPVAAQADSPRQFLRHALQGDNSEIMLGHLAQDRAASPMVRAYGRTLAQDHQKARIQVIAVGQRFGLNDEGGPTNEARQERSRLMGLSGHGFDAEFIRYIVDDHRKDIAEFRNEAAEHHGAVSALAEEQLPTLQEHLRLASSLEDSIHRYEAENGANPRGYDRGYTR